MSASALAITDSQNKQTGPRTEAGKERSSNNATVHGGTSTKLIVPGESQADFDALFQGLRDDYRPDTLPSQMFVENLAMSQWFLWRRQRAYAAMEASVYEDQSDETQWTDEHLKRLLLADRYRTQADRAFRRALINVEKWQKEKRDEAAREQRNLQWEAGNDLRDRRMTLKEQNFAFAQAREANRAFRFAKTGPSAPAEAQITHQTSATDSNRELSILERGL